MRTTVSLSALALLVLLTGCNQPEEASPSSDTEAAETESMSPEATEAEALEEEPDATEEDSADEPIDLMPGGDSADNDGTDEDSTNEDSTNEDTTSEYRANEDGAGMTPENPDAVLSPAETLMADTVEAATHSRSESKLTMVGAWAASPDGCALIDQDVYDGFAVITPTSMRMFEEMCTFETPAPGQSSYSIEATCSAEGETYPLTVSIEMENAERMKLVMAEGTAGFDLGRCHLPY